MVVKSTKMVVINNVQQLKQLPFTTSGWQLARRLQSEEPKIRPCLQRTTKNQ
jgi:hypothetical protein